MSKSSPLRIAFLCDGHVIAINFCFKIVEEIFNRMQKAEIS